MPQTKKIILASTSPYRKKLLEQIHLPHSTVAPTVDEELLKKNSTVSIPDLPLFLAEKKAESIAALHPDALVIGCDQMGLMQNTPLNKAKTKDKAVEQLLLLQGKSHQLITAMVVCHGPKKLKHVDYTTLHMRPLSQKQIRHYVDLDNPLDCAGSYKIESLGISLFEKIETQDHTAIVGLPLMALVRLLDSLGYATL